MLSARSAEQLRQTEMALCAIGAEVAVYAGDVGDPDQIGQRIEATTAAASGGIDVLVNKVGGGARIADSTDGD